MAPSRLPPTSSRSVLRGTIRVDAPPERALHLFTPVGERLWAAGWDPIFPAGEQGDGAEPGTVFVTAAHGHETIWVALDRGADAVRYARITPGHLAGTVDVKLRDGEAEVTYDLTALTAEAQPELDHFAADYDAFLAEWERAIAALDAG